MLPLLLLAVVSQTKILGIRMDFGLRYNGTYLIFPFL